MDVVAVVLTVGFFGAIIWGVHGVWERRCVAAARQAAAEMEGRYEKGGRFSGGRIYGRRGDRDVVVDFHTGSSSTPAKTSALAVLKPPLEKKIRVRRRLFGGWKGVEALPPGAAALLGRLEAFRFAELEASSTMLSLRAGGVLHRAERIVELASIAAAMAVELERR